MSCDNFIETSERATGMLGRVLSEVCGPMETTSIGGAKYFVASVEEHSNCVMVYCLMKSLSGKLFLKPSGTG